MFAMIMLWMNRDKSLIVIDTIVLNRRKDVFYKKYTVFAS